MSKDNCPKCGAEVDMCRYGYPKTYTCRSAVGWYGNFNESTQCLRNQRDWLKQELKNEKFVTWLFKTAHAEFCNQVRTCKVKHLTKLEEE